MCTLRPSTELNGVSSAVRGEVAVLQLVRSALALPGAFSRSEAKCLLDPLLTSLLPQKQEFLGGGSSLSGSSNRSWRDSNGSSIGSNSIAIARSSSSSSIANHHEITTTRFEAWTILMQDYAAWKIEVHPDILSYYAGCILIDQLSATSDLKLRVASLCSVLALTLQPAGYQADQQWLDDLERLLQIVPNQFASSTRGSSPWQAVFAAEGAFQAQLTVLQLHQLMCYLHSCTTCHPSAGLLGILTASVGLNTAGMDLACLVDLAYILAQWGVTIPASVYQQLLICLSPASSEATAHTFGQANDAISGKDNLTPRSRSNAFVFRQLTSLQLLHLVWLQQHASGKLGTLTLLLPTDAAWDRMYCNSLEALSNMPADQLVDIGVFLLSHAAKTSNSTTLSGSRSKNAQLWLAAYSNAASSLDAAWITSDANLTRLAEVVVQLHKLSEV